MHMNARAPTIDDLRRLAEQVLAEMPAEFSRVVEGVAIQVVDFADDETLDAMGMESPYDLLGLYHGIPFGSKGSAIQTQPDMIFLYRRPILEYWSDSGEELGHVVRHVLIHEIGHHYGLSDDDMDRIEASVVDD